MRPGLPPIPPPPTRPRWAVVVVAALVALALGVVGTLTVLATGSGGPAGQRLLAPTDAPSEPSASPTPGATTPPPPPPTPEPTGGPVDVAGAVVTVPAGWRFETSGEGAGCVTRATGTCELRVLVPDVVTARGGVLEEPQTDADDGWYLGTGIPLCEDSDLVTRDLAPVDDKRAEYREWELDCADTPAAIRMWWLPKTRMAFVDESGDAAVGEVLDAIVRTTDLSGLRSA